MGKPSAAALQEIVKRSDAVSQAARSVLGDAAVSDANLERAIVEMAEVMETLIAEWRPEPDSEFSRQREVFDLVAEAARIFGVEGGLAWLNSPNRALGDRTPLSVVTSSPGGPSEARAVLGRLEEGIFS
jgi:hypothetical protein